MQVGWSLFLETEDDPSLSLCWIFCERIGFLGFSKFRIPPSLPVASRCSQQSLAPPPRPPRNGNGPGMQFYSPLCLYRLAQGGHICCMINQHWSCLVGLLVTLMSISWDRISAFSKHFIFWPLASPLAHPCNVPKLHFAVYWRYAECQENLRNIEDTWWSRE